MKMREVIYTISPNRLVRRAAERRARTHARSCQLERLGERLTLCLFASSLPASASPLTRAQNTMSSLFRDGASSVMHLVKDTWFPVACGAVPLVATLRCGGY